MDERLAELTRISLRGVARHNPAADLTIHPNGEPPPDPLQLQQEIKQLEAEKPQDVRIVRRRRKRKGFFKI